MLISSGSDWSAGTGIRLLRKRASFLFVGSFVLAFVSQEKVRGVTSHRKGKGRRSRCCRSLIEG